MAFNTRGNPRLGQSPPALTSLGAVGGARGVSAGALRILVEFISTYDKAAANQLQSDLNNVDHAANNSKIAETKRLRELSQLRHRINEIDRVSTGKLNSAFRTDLKEILALQGARSKQDKALLVSKKTAFENALKGLGVTDKEVQQLYTRERTLKRISVLEERQKSGQVTQNRLARERVQVEGQMSKIQQVRASFLPKLQGLAIGAIGGIFGGAVLGVGFQLAQTALEKVGDLIQDLIDPARHAREVMVDLAKAVNDIASQEKISQLQAASKIVANFGIGEDRSKQLASTLAEAAAIQAVIDALETQGKVTDVLNHIDQIRARLLDSAKDKLREEAKATGTYRSETEKVIAGTRVSRVILHEYVGELTLEQAALNRVNLLLDINSDQSLKAASAAERLAAAQQLAAFAADKFANAIRDLSAQRQAGFQAQIEGLSEEPSARTKALEAAIERAQGGGASNAAALRANAEERALILLRQRLRLLGANIDLEKFSGKFLLEAINAKIRALQKEGDEQDRLNELLDRQYEASKIIRRQQGESITDFVERRAQIQRQQLADQQKAEREALIQTLEDKQTIVEDEVALIENAEARKSILAQAGSNARLKALQKALDASKKADREELERKRKLIADKAKAEEKAANEAIRVANETYNKQFLSALSATKKIEDLFALSAEVQGLRSAEAFLRAFGANLVSTGLMTQQELDSGIARIQAALSAYSARRTRIITGHAGRSGPQEFQHGGVMMLNNAHSPFGQNVKLGEAGDEIGVVLSNKVASILKKQGEGVGQVGPFHLYGSVDPLGDKYRFKRMVKEAVQEAIR